MTETTSTATAEDSAGLLRPGRARFALVAAAALAPLAQLGWALTLTSAPSDDLPTAYAKLSENPFLFELNLATQPLFGLVAVVSALVIGAALRAGAPVLAAIGTVVAAIGGAVGWAGPSGPAVLAAARAGMPADEALALNASVEGQLGSMISFVAFPLIPLGYLLFGIAAIVAARRRRFPLWAAIVLLVSVPVILVGGAFSSVFLVVGWVGVVVGVTVAALAWARSVRGA